MTKRIFFMLGVIAGLLFGKSVPQTHGTLQDSSKSKKPKRQPAMPNMHANGRLNSPPCL
jgi:hypothetical protein